MSDRRTISVTINGETFEREVETRLTLADFIRHECLLTGTHVGCEHGVCGACTILLNGRTARSCLMLAVQANGQEITTIEGIAPNDEELEFLQDNPDPTEREVREAISGNLCRCTGYQGIVAAALDAAKRLQAGA
jgi:carbon-monoxide dehydrogenase small subunit